LNPPQLSNRASYGRHLAVCLAAAFTLSAVHTGYGWVTGIGDPRFTVTIPVAWAFYAAGAAAAVLALRAARLVQWVLTVYLAVLLLVAIFWYSTTFAPRQQTTFGWLENDVYTALLVLGFYLSVLRLRGITLTPSYRQAPTP
jgi:peptidoglycan/LPS O-acetylase OafA/YrhL